MTLVRSTPALRKLLTPRLNKYIRHSPTPKQAAFLVLDQIEAMYGGAAGGGKSDALLMAALQYVDVPGYAALLLRRTYADLKLPEALMDRAAQWLAGLDAKWVSNATQWRFPSGATLTFGYLDAPRSEERYQSSAYQFIGLDELTQFTERQYRYMFSRLRRIEGMAVPLRMRSATNPGGVGHEWVKARFVNPGAPDRPFIRALLIDNPYLDQREYEESLALLTPTQRAWYRYGDWDAIPEGAIAQREWFPIVERAPLVARRVRFWDFASTRATARGDPDWTVGTRISEADGLYYVEHVLRGRWGPGEVENIVKQTAAADPSGTAIGLEQEGGSAGVLFTQSLIRALAGYYVRAFPAVGDKVTRTMPFIGQAQNGYVRLVRGSWNETWLDEITMVPNYGHDDQWDSAGGAFAMLFRGLREARSHDG